MQAYDVAADWYLGEDSKAWASFLTTNSRNANACLLKVGILAAQLEQYEKAIEKFEVVAVASVDNNLTKCTLSDIH